MDQFELLALKQRLVPLIVPLLREARSSPGGRDDPRTAVYLMFGDAAQRTHPYVGLNVRLGLTEGGITAGDWNACVDTAALQL